MHWRTSLASRTTSKPLMRAMPERRQTSVVSMRISVDLPAPFGPSRPNTSPCSTLKLSPVDGAEVPKYLVRFVDLDVEHGARRSQR